MLALRDLSKDGLTFRQNLGITSPQVITQSDNSFQQFNLLRSNLGLVPPDFSFQKFDLLRTNLGVVAQSSNQTITVQDTYPINFNAFKRRTNLSDGGSAIAGSWTTITDNTTAVSGTNYSLNFSTEKTLTLPASPSVNDTVGIRLIGTANAIIACNSLKIGSYANDKIIKPTFALTEITLTYSGTTNGWIATIYNSQSISCNSVYIRAKFWDKFVHYYDFRKRRADYIYANAKELITNAATYIQETINSVSQDGVSLSNTSIRCTSDSSFNVGQHSLICGFQHNATTTTVYPGIVVKRQSDSSNFEYGLVLQDTPVTDRNTISYQVSATGNAGTSYAQSPWATPVAVNTPAFLHGYYNGSVVGHSLNAGTPQTSAYTGGIFAGSSNFEVGGRGHTSASTLSTSKFYFVGLTNSVLTQSEIDEIYNGGAWVKMP